jgi:hypothetical protein
MVSMLIYVQLYDDMERLTILVWKKKKGDLRYAYS